jgi:putative transposase
MRKARVLVEGARYHVTARANWQVMILSSSAIKEMFLKVLRDAKRKYAFGIENFCIMRNHVHLVIRPAKGDSLSVIMKWILGVFSLRFNRRVGLKGHAWAERFFSRIITGREDYRRVFEYLQGNPALAGVTPSGLEWRYTGFWHFMAGRTDILGKLPRWLAIAYRGCLGAAGP